MGVAMSKVEEDKALQLCRERKKFVRQALDGRCSLAAAHVAYIQSLKNTGTALRRFLQPEAPVESSLYTSTTATPGQLALTEKSLSQFSFSSPSQSQLVDATDTLSPSPSPSSSSRFHVNHMKFRGSSSKKIEEKPGLLVIGTVTSSTTPQSITPSSERPEASPFEAQAPPPPSGSPPWDYFGLFHPNENQVSDHEGRELNQGLENADDIRRLREEEGITDLEDDEEENLSSPGTEEYQESEDEFDEPPADTLVRSFENLNRASDHVADMASPTMPSMPSAETVASETQSLNGEKSNLPESSPLRGRSSGVGVPTDVKGTPMKEDAGGNKVASKDFFSSIKEIEYLFIKASESGKEVPRMLEATKLHFRPMFPGKEGGIAKTFFKACFSCGEDPSQVPEEPVQTAVRYLTWHRTTSSHSSSSRNPLTADSRDDIEGLTSNLFDNYCMISGSHASTLDRLYAWERKLYDEVKASEMVRREYDRMCKFLRQQESKGEASRKIDRTRAIVKDLHSRIRVAIHRIDTISKRIEELRDKELQPQLEELIEGLCRMWEVMLECHKFQYQIISIAYYNGNTKILIHSESHRQNIIYLENELSFLSSSFTKWTGAQKSYLQAIDGWLSKCVSLPKKTSRRKRRDEGSFWRKCGPPIYVTCGCWLEMLDKLPTKEVVDAIKGLATETTHFLPRQEKKQGKSMNNPLPRSLLTGTGDDSSVNLLRDEAASEDWISGFVRFRSSLTGFLGQLNKFAESSVGMYKKLEEDIKDSKIKYDQLRSQTVK